ncbi:MAG TPA: leucyl/phenylalanyl-tRNA--protein transferase [Gammaproteobacteria bacterium]
MSYQPIWITDESPPGAFPDIDAALIEPNGLLAIGGDLSPARLIYAYRHGIFPWYSDGQPILWWSPDPRAVLFCRRMHVSRSLAKLMRQHRFQTTLDRAFDDVVAGCAEPRSGQDGTWITRGMMDAYSTLHGLGHAHSIECWRGGSLVGGIYGVAIGRVFFGESMFSREPNASKVALADLCALGFELVDCQIPNPHLQRLGAEMIPRREFAELLSRWCDDQPVIHADARRAAE